MKINLILIIGILSFGYLFSFGQIENIKIETYYISDAEDATDTVGGQLAAGSTTYRIYVDLLPGSSIRAIYGDEHHPLIISSGSSFFNHREEGITFGKDFNKNRYATGTAPLDTYLTIGQCSKSFAQGAYFGILKEDDHDGSIVGGPNNDGGSQEIAGGLLSNDSSLLGIPLPIADGLSISEEIPDSWIDVGFKDVLTNSDTTIFGLISDKKRFESTKAILRNSGVYGVLPDQNEVLIAQLTTDGEIIFEFNLEIEILKDGNLRIIKYVARNEFLDEDEIFNPLLSYPYECGCTDPAYLEASTLFACSDNSKCITPAVLGCMDSLACNFDPKANLDFPSLCCYIGYCHDLDISIVCPDLQPRLGLDTDHIRLYPNPAFTTISLDLAFVRHNDIHFVISDIYGRQWQSGILPEKERPINIEPLVPGLYVMQLSIGDEIFALPFIKM